MRSGTLVESIFVAALQRPSAAERAAYLEAACGGDAALRSEIERLLAAHPRAVDFLEQPAAAAFAAGLPGELTTGAVPPAADEADPLRAGLGERVGPYKLLQQLGEGGMGVVYLAEQQVPVRRQVALKVVKAGMDSAQVLARFEQERQALALMDHPHIAKVLDAGTTAQGRPYFVMELVKGTPITKYCDERRLTPRQRLELFVPVCQALQHAHQKGIIHRDIKPSNVLVAPYDGHPVVKVIDFGVAKAAGQRLTERTLFTEVGSVVGTLEYMSPEQAELNNQDIDTRSDIYSLGVLLYQLLTGTTPLTREQLKQVAFTEVLRLIREEDPPRPSTRLSESKDSLPSVSAQRQMEPAKLARLVRGELDWIVMKALEKDRGRRYETADGLARDLQRYLVDEPVEACPPSASYRLRKYLRRHRGSVLAAALVLFGLLAGTVGTTIGLVQARAERDRARQAEAVANEQRDQKAEAEQAARLEADKARAFSQFLTDDLLAQADPALNAPMDRLTVLELVDRASAQVEGRFASQPLIEAEIRRTLGQVYLGLGQLERAEDHLRAALALNRRLGDAHPETCRTTAVLGWVVGERNQSRWEEGFELLRTSVAGLSAVLGPDHPDTLTAKISLACAYKGTGRIAEAVALCQETERLARTRLGPGHRDTWRAILNLAALYQETGRREEGLAQCQEALRLAQDQLGPDHPGTLLALNHLSWHYLRTRQVEQAAAQAKKALAISQATLRPDSLWTFVAMSQVALVYHEAGRSQPRWLPEAIEWWKKVLQRAQDKLGPDHGETLNVMAYLGDAYLLGKQPDLALPLLEDALPRARTHLGSDHVVTLKAMHNLADAYALKGQNDKALLLHQETVARARAKFGPQDSLTFLCLGSLARAYTAANRPGDAVPAFEELLRLRKAQRGEDFDAPGITMNLAVAYREAGRLEEAVPLFERLIQLRTANLGADDPRVATVQDDLGRTLVRQRKYAEAEPLLRAALAVRQKAKSGGWLAASTQAALGEALAGLRKYAEAEELLLAGYQGLTKAQDLPPRSRPRRTQVLESLVQLYDAMGQQEKAEAWRKRLEETQAAAMPPAGP
jgi:serine/threonine protein kinase